MSVIAYHFTSETLRDGRPVPAIGETLRHEGKIIWCQSGLYASPKAHMALKYAPGNWLHMVECNDILREDDDKLVCRERTILKTIDAEYLLRRFAADQALSVAHLWDMPDIVREYLTDLDEQKRIAAGAAARDAWNARIAAWDAAGAAWAAWAARNAAWAAAGAAARDAAWADFDARVEKAFEA